MTDKFRYRHGNTNPAEYAVDSAVLVNTGDMVRLVTDDVRPAGYDSNADGTGDLWAGSLAATQVLFAKDFVGVAAGRSIVGESYPIRVNRQGVHEFACAAATFEVGDLVGPAKTSGNNLEDQKVVGVADPLYAIGRVFRRYTSNTTKVLVELKAGIVFENGIFTYNLADLGAGNDLAESIVWVPPFAAEILDVLVTPDGDDAGVDNSNTSVWTVKNGSATVVTATYDATNTFPDDGVQTSLGSVANNVVAPGGTVTLTVTNGAAANLPACQVAIRYRKATAQ